MLGSEHCGVVVGCAVVVVVVVDDVDVVVCVWQFVKSVKTFGEYTQMHTLKHVHELPSPDPVDASQKIGTTK